jgi:hypothetical protein
VGAGRPLQSKALYKPSTLNLCFAKQRFSGLALQNKLALTEQSKKRDAVERKRLFFALLGRAKKREPML